MEDIQVVYNLPKVSVIVPFYSNVKWLEEAIDSVLAQDYTYYEIIVVNDGSEFESVKAQAKENCKKVNGREYLMQFADKKSCLRKYTDIFNGVLKENRNGEGAI